MPIVWIGGVKIAIETDDFGSVMIKDPANQVAEATYFTGYPMGHMEGFTDSHKMCFKSFYDELAGKNPPVKMPTLAKGHREICISVRQSWNRMKNRHG